MNRSVNVLATTPRAKHASRYEIGFAGRLAVRPNPLPASNARRMLKARKHKHLVLDNKRKVQASGKEKRVLPVGHAPCQTVAYSAHASCGEWPHRQADKIAQAQNRLRHSPPLAMLFKAVNVVKSAAKQPASEYRRVSRCERDCRGNRRLKLNY